MSKTPHSLCVNKNSVHGNLSTQGNINVDDDDAQCLCLNEFLHKYDSCFANKILNKIPPIRGDDDHRIELI